MARGRIGIDELIQLPTPSDAQISPDGRLVAFTLRTTDWERNKYCKNVWMVPGTGGEPSPACPDLHASAWPRWAPDGNRFLVIGREKPDSGLAVFAISWSEAGDSSISFVAPLPPGGHHVAWSSDGTMISCIAPLPPTGKEAEFESKYGRVEIADEARTGSRVWIAGADGGEFSAVNPNGLASGADIREACWHPTERTLVLAVASGSTPEFWDRGELMIYRAEEDRLEPIPCGIGCGSPVWSPCGQQIAFMRYRVPTFSANNETCLYHVADQSVAARIVRDEEVKPLAWREDGLYFLSLVRTDGHLFRFDPGTEAVEQVTRNVEDGFAIVEGWGGEGCSFDGADSQLAAVCYTQDAPGEIAVIDLASGKAHAITEYRSSLRVRLPSSELVRWEASDGTSIEGVLHRERGDGEPRNAPLAVVIHGGPTALAFRAPLVDSDWKLSAIPMLTALGVIVLRPNYRGSAGYGEAFRMANIGSLGEVNVDDICSGIDSLVERGWVDPERVATSGMSHGGYLSAFLATSTDRLSAAIMQGGIADWMLNYGCNMQPDWERQYFGGTPAEKRDLYGKLSPLHRIGGRKTPVLILHGDSDRQAPTANATAFYRGLRDAGVPARLVLYGNTGHGPSRPRELRHHMEEVVSWMKQRLVESSTDSE